MKIEINISDVSLTHVVYCCNRVCTIDAQMNKYKILYPESIYV